MARVLLFLPFSRLIVQVIVLRHSLFALQNHDVMAADFGKVAWVTFAILASIVALMVGLDAAGVAQVRYASNEYLS